jgi:cation-transporting ATPase 13A3/4/5
MHGAVLEHLFLRSDDEEILKLISRTALFGRCRPEHKAMVIKSLKRLGIVCAMVGDGANDCPAIKAADLGISFTSADGSISAPFSALSPSVDCVEKLLMEGKCSL